MSQITGCNPKCGEKSITGRLRSVGIIIDYRIQGLETVKITGLSAFHDSVNYVPWPGHFCELCRENSRYI